MKLINENRKYIYYTSLVLENKSIVLSENKSIVYDTRSKNLKYIETFNIAIRQSVVRNGTTNGK